MPGISPGIRAAFPHALDALSAYKEANASGESAPARTSQIQGILKSNLEPDEKLAILNAKCFVDWASRNNCKENMVSRNLSPSWTPNNNFLKLAKELGSLDIQEGISPPLIREFNRKRDQSSWYTDYLKETEGGVTNEDLVREMDILRLAQDRIGSNTSSSPSSSDFSPQVNMGCSSGAEILKKIQEVVMNLPIFQSCRQNAAITDQEFLP